MKCKSSTRITCKRNFCPNKHKPILPKLSFILFYIALVQVSDCVTYTKGSYFTLNLLQIEILLSFQQYHWCCLQENNPMTPYQTSWPLNPHPWHYCLLWVWIQWRNIVMVTSPSLLLFAIQYGNIITLQSVFLASKLLIPALMWIAVFQTCWLG